MSIVFMDSFDHYLENGVTEIADKYSTTVDTNVTISTAGRTANCWAAAAGALPANAAFQNNYTDVNSNQYLGASFALVDVAAATPFLEVQFTAAGGGALQTFTMEYKSGGGITLKETSGGVTTVNITTYADGSTIADALRTEWTYIEICFAHSTTQNTLGYQLRINDKFVAAANDTATATAATSSNYIKLQAANPTTTQKIDDLIMYNGQGMEPDSGGGVNVDWLGAISITALLPIADTGTESTVHEWAGPHVYDGADDTPYQAVDDAYSDLTKDTDYLVGTLVGQRERFSITDAATGGGEILAGQVTARLKNGGTASELNVHAMTNDQGNDVLIDSAIDIGGETSAFIYKMWQAKGGTSSFPSNVDAFNDRAYGLKIV